MSFFTKFKRHPSVPTDGYFAQVQTTAINLDDPLMQQALSATTNGLETYPNLSLSDLKTFLAFIQQNIVIPNGEAENLGAISFATPGRKDTVNPTGLTYEPVIITMDSENFVVETARNIFNDPETRNADDIEYQDIAESLTALMQASLAYTDFSKQDMPALPDESTYMEALETGENLAIEAEVYLPDTTAGADDTQVAGADTQVAGADTQVTGADTEIIPLPSNQSATSTNDKPAQQADTLPEQQPQFGKQSIKHASVTETHVQTPEEHEQTPKAHSTITNTYAMPNIKQAQHINLDVPLFSVDAALVKQTVKPTDPMYVQIELAKEMQEANNYLSTAGTNYERTIKDKLLALDANAAFQEKVDALLADDWQEVLKNQITEEETTEFKARYQTEQGQLAQTYAAKVEEENARHERALKQLTADEVSETTRLKQTLKRERQQAIQQHQTQAVTEQQTYIEQQIQALQRDTAAEQEKQVLKLLNTLKPHAVQSLQDNFKHLEERLASTKSDLVAEHEQALTQQTQQEELAQNKRDRVAEQQQLSTLRDSETTLTEKLHKLSADVSQYSAANDALTQHNHELNERATAAEARLQDLQQVSQQAESNDLLKAFLLNQAQDKSKAAETPKAKTWPLAVVSVAAIFGIGGTGALAYSQQQAFASYKSKADAQAKERQSSTVKLAPNKESQKDVSKDKVKDRFELLDSSIKKGSLAVYNGSFKNKNLETQARTLAVGKLLVTVGENDSAWSLANANTGHNSQLIDYLNEQ